MFENLLRSAIEMLYTGKCDVIEHVKSIDPVTKKTVYTEQVVLSNQSCRLSYNSSPTSSDDKAPEIVQEIKLFIAPDVVIKDGSKIEVTQNGVMKAYKNSGEPMLYGSHQEIRLQLFERWA